MEFKSEGETTKSHTLSQQQLKSEMPLGFGQKVDLRLEKFLHPNHRFEDQIFQSIQHFADFTAKPNKPIVSELNKLTSEDLFALLYSCSSVLLKKYLLVLDQRHRQYFYQNTSKALSHAQVSQIQSYFINFVQVSKAA